MWSEGGGGRQKMSIHVHSLESQKVNGLLKTTNKENSRPVQPTDKVH